MPSISLADTQKAMDQAATKPVIPVIAPQDEFSIQHNAGKCVHPRGGTAGQGVVATLYNGCAEKRLKFKFLADGSIQHVASGLCLHPEGGTANNGTRAVFWSGCNASNLQYEHLANGAIKHKQSGRCLHPEGGSSDPGDNTNLVFWDDCSAGDRIKFKKNTDVQQIDPLGGWQYGGF